VVGGLIAAAPAATLYTFQDQLGISIRPSLVIAAGVVVLLSGLSLVGSVQDAIMGAPITAVARFFEVVMMTGGIIAGVAIS
ncbi:threonine/serine exporter family protein, partial [Rhodococcus erythropolis]|nr:threonine/serine exporter family protein [Rhodococcus erythropolis]MDJ0114613.1 threonine/serine exporter family protein [Rhodococcus erythropolis]